MHLTHSPFAAVLAPFLLHSLVLQASTTHCPANLLLPHVW